MKHIRTVTVDDIGRLLFPAEIRHMLGWDVESKIGVFYVDNNTAILQLEKEPNEFQSNICGICEKQKKQITVKGINICEACAQHIATLAELRGIGGK